MKPRQDPKTVLSSIVKHSLGMVDQERQDKVQAFILSIAKGENDGIAVRKVKKGRDGLSR